MFRFAEPEYLYGLLLLPLLIALAAWSEIRARKRMKRFGEWQLLSQLTEGMSVTRTRIKGLLLILSVALAVVMLARPQYGTHVDTTERRGIEAVIALDVSNSMMATDVTPNRLERAKMLVSNLADKMTDDKVGLNVFAGDAYIQLPITNDYVSAKMFLDAINPGMVGVQGTNLAEAINLASKSFTQTEGVGKAIIVITDGENHEPGAEEAAREAAKAGRNIFILGIGTPEGSPIPTPDGYLQDQSGQTVVTKLNEAMCRELAEAGKGTYIHVDNSIAAQDRLNAALDQLAKKEMETPVYSEFDEQFQAVALVLLIVLLAELFMLECENPLFKKLKLFRK